MHTGSVQSGYEQFGSSYDYGFERVFGPVDAPVIIPHSNINVAGQMRDTFDPEELDELKGSLDNQDMQNPVIVYEVNKETMEWYIGICNASWSAQTDPRSFRPTKDDSYYVLVAGERRYRAIGLLAQESGHDTSEIGVSCFVKQASSPLEMMNIQGAENIHSRPKPFQYAVMIHSTYLLGLEAGLYTSPEEFIRDYSFAGREASKNALRFFELPAYVRDKVKEGKLIYGHSIEFLAFCSAYGNMLDQRDDITDEERGFLFDEKISAYTSMLIESGSAKADLPKLIEAWIEELAYVQPGFDFEGFMADQTERWYDLEKERILKTKREIINNSARNMQRHSDALSLIAEANPELFEGLQSNLRRQLEVAGRLYQSLIRAHTGRNIADLLSQRNSELDLILEELPDDPGMF